MEQFLTFFIPLFVAIDPIGMVPVFLALTDGQDAMQRRRISVQAVAAATVIALGFMFLGRGLFDFLHIQPDDFRIAGGIILLVLAIYDLIIYGKPAVHETHLVGLVPLAMPLIAGPATLTTLLVLTSQPTDNSYALTTLALVVNMALLLLILFGASWISRVVGEHTMAALSKLVMVLLAAIAVNFIRVGITNAVHAVTMPSL
jgi:multiple antibiotic resistance protein